MDVHNDAHGLSRRVPRRSVLRMAGAAAAAPAIGSLRPAPPAHATHTSVKASAVPPGFNSVDSTECLQNALDSGAHEVIIDRVVEDGVLQDWITGPLFVTRDNFQITFEWNVRLVAKTGAFNTPSDASLISIINRSGVTLAGSGILRMFKREYTGESHMGILMRSSHNIVFDGLRIVSTGGDGIYIGSGGALPYCSNITVRNVTCHDNKRNGIGVISVDGLLMEGCRFYGASGTDPEGGVDFEPNHPANWPGQRLENITVRDCVFEENVRDNVRIVTQNMDAAQHPPVDILFDRVRLGAQVGGEDGRDRPNFRFIGPVTGVDDAGGLIEFRDSLIRNEPRSSSVGIFRNRAAGGTQIEFKRTGIWSWDTARHTLGPIALGPANNEVDSMLEYGGVTFAGSWLFTNGGNPFLHPHLEPPGTPGMAGLHGTLAVVNPTVVAQEDYGANPHDIDLVLTRFTTAPAQTVTVAANPTTIQTGGDTSTITFTRTGPSLFRSLVIAYRLAGTAVPRYDYAGLSGVAVIPPGLASITVTLRSRTRPDPAIGPRSVDVIVDAFAAAYTIGAPGSVRINITNT